MGVGHGRNRKAGPTRADPPLQGVATQHGSEYNQTRARASDDLPEPVTRATLPSSEAEARPRGPGMASYLLPVRSEVIPGILREKGG